MLKGTHTRPVPESAAATPDAQSAFIHFITDDGREFGFPFSQLLHFVLEPASGSDAAPQRLLFAFPSHDVTVTGFRLHRLCRWLDEQKPLRLKAEDARFTNLHDNLPFVASVRISPAAPT